MINLSSLPLFFACVSGSSLYFGSEGCWRKEGGFVVVLFFEFINPILLKYRCSGGGIIEEGW